MQRLQKIIAQNSEYSRRAAEKLIANGQVHVNGKLVTELGTKVKEDSEITIDGHLIYRPDMVYYLLNKPIGYISSRKDNFDRPIVTELIDEVYKIYPVGRLDYNTSGLIILTNDGELANGLMHPKNNIDKTYIAKIDGEYTEKDLDQLRNGVVIDGKKTSPATVENIRYNNLKKVGVVKITIHEGRNQQVRKMFRAINTKVYRLERVNYAFFELDKEKMAPGAYRVINKKEVEELKELILN